MKKPELEPNEGRFRISVTYADGVTGFMTGADGKVLRYQTRQKAEKAISALLKGARYSFLGASLTCVEDK